MWPKPDSFMICNWIFNSSSVFKSKVSTRKEGDFGVLAPCCPQKVWLVLDLVVLFADASKKHKNKSFHGCGGQVEAKETEGISGEPAETSHFLPWAASGTSLGWHQETKQRHFVLVLWLVEVMQKFSQEKINRGRENICISPCPRGCCFWTMLQRTKGAFALLHSPSAGDGKLDYAEFWGFDQSPKLPRASPKIFSACMLRSPLTATCAASLNLEEGQKDWRGS